MIDCNSYGNYHALEQHPLCSFIQEKTFLFGKVFSLSMSANTYYMIWFHCYAYQDYPR